jgi:hypothetical protein
MVEYLLLLSNLLLDSIELGSNLSGRVPCSAGFFVQGDHFLDNFLGSKTLALALLDLVNVTTAFGDEIIEVEHIGLTELEN